MATFHITVGIISICAIFCLVVFVILLMRVDPPVLITPSNRTKADFIPDFLRRSSNDNFANITLEDEATEDVINVDELVEKIVSSSISQLNNSSDNIVAELSDTIITRLRENLMKNIKRAIPKIIQNDEEETKVQTKIDTKVPEKSLVMNDDVVAINITDVVGQPLVELKLYSYKSGKAASKDADLITASSDIDQK